MRTVILCLALLCLPVATSAGTLDMASNPCSDFVATMQKFHNRNDIVSYLVLGETVYGYYMGMIGNPALETDATTGFVQRFGAICSANPAMSMLDVLKAMAK